MRGGYIFDTMPPTKIDSLSSSPTNPTRPNDEFDQIPTTEIKIPTDGGHIFPQNEIEQQMRINRDKDKAAAIGGNMDSPKLPNMICISGCNLNGINCSNL